METNCRTCLYEGQYLSNLMQKNVCERCLLSDNFSHWQPKKKEDK